MSASLASWSTSSQPSSTMGATTMASTPWLMKLRTRADLCGGSLSAALNTRSNPLSFEKASFIDSVLALRQPDSEPVCAKPTLIWPPLAESLPESESLPQPAATNARAPSIAIPVRNLVFTPEPSLVGPVVPDRLSVPGTPGTAHSCEC